MRLSVAEMAVPMWLLWLVLGALLADRTFARESGTGRVQDRHMTLTGVQLQVSWWRIALVD